MGQATCNPYETWGHGHMLSLLLNARDPNGQPTFSRRQIHDEVHVLVTQIGLWLIMIALLLAIT